MRKLIPFTVVLALAAGNVFAQDAVVRSETTEKTQSSPAGSSSTKVETSSRSETSVDGTTTQNSSVTTTYETRLENAYRNAGVSASDIAKLRELDLRVREARRAGETAKVQEIYTQQTRILKPEQLQQVRTYLVEHPAPKTVPAYEVTTYETVPTGPGVSVNTPLGNIGVGVNTGSTVVERKEVVPAR